MNTTQKTQTTVLPVSGTSAPGDITGYTVKAYRSMLTPCGLADSGNLYRGTRKVGTVQQDGNGGMTYARWDDADARTAFEQAVGGPDNVENALDALMLETLAVREVKKHARKWLLVVAEGEDVGEYKGLRKIPVTDKVREAIATSFGQGARYWDGQAWTAVTA